jgi:type I restriction enzyme, S subunit
MDAKQFLAEFGHIANAPGGVVRLRELILQLAIQGKLINSDIASESSQISLASLKAIKAQLVADKKLPREKPYPEISVAELPIDRPLHWEWARFGDVWQLLSGRDLENNQYNGSKNGIPYITGASNIENGVINVNRWTDQPVVISVENDLLITCKGTIGKTVFNEIGEMHIARQIMAIRNFSEKMDTGFLKIWLDGFVSQLVEKSKSMIPGFSREDLIYAIYPLPPLEEQACIVAKVDELMALCDKLEAQQQQRRSLQNHLRQSTLQAVAAANSPHELQIAWTRLAENFGQLFYGPEDVVGFKGLILDLAVSGQLLKNEQQTSFTGLELLEAIAAKRIAWSKESEGQEQKEAIAMLKKLRTQQVATPDVSLPANWVWASMLQISKAIVDCHNKTAPYVNEGIHLIRTTDIRNGQIDLSNTRKISEETYNYWARRMSPQSGDIFFTREAPMGEAAIVPKGSKVCLRQRTMLIRLFEDLFSNRFLLYVIQSPSFQARMIEAAIGMTVKHLRVGGVEDLIVPVPPKIEQDQIVTIIDRLFSICDHYTIQLSRKQKKAANLAISAVAHITGIRNQEKEEPKTELLAPLRLGTPPSIKEQAPLAAILANQNGAMVAKDLWQRFGGEIDAFYTQLKLEVEKGWILETEVDKLRQLEIA